MKIHGWVRVILSASYLKKLVSVLSGSIPNVKCLYHLPQQHHGHGFLKVSITPWLLDHLDCMWPVWHVSFIVRNHVFSTLAFHWFVQMWTAFYSYLGLYQLFLYPAAIFVEKVGTWCSCIFRCCAIPSLPSYIPLPSKHPTPCWLFSVVSFV